MLRLITRGFCSGKSRRGAPTGGQDMGERAEVGEDGRDVKPGRVRPMATRPGEAGSRKSQHHLLVRS